MIEPASGPRVPSRFRNYCLPGADRVPSFPVSRIYPARHTLFRQGDTVENVFYLEQGLVKLVRGDCDGRDERIIGLRADGWVIGADAGILGEPCVATAVTIEPCRIARMGIDDFLARLQIDRALAAAILRMHAREVHAELTQRAESSTSARSRLERLLHNLASSDSPDGVGEIRVRMPLRQWEVAQLLGVAPPYLCQLMAEMEAEGVLRRERGFIVHNLSAGSRRDIRRRSGTPPHS